MRRLWSVLLTLAVLGWGLVSGTSPAWAYHPPLPTTATIGSDGNGITLTANDPQAGTVSAAYPDFKEVSYSQKDGIVAWESVVGASDTSFMGFLVSYAIYDPFLKAFKVETQGPFLQPGQISIADGVVGFIPWVASTNKREFRYSTYDPAKGAWQNRSWQPTGSGTAGYQAYPSYITTKDGVVLCGYMWEIAGAPGIQYEADADIYDASSGKWSSEVSGVPDIVYVDSFKFISEIKNATVYITYFPMPEVTLKRVRGYDTGKDAWYEGPTKPMAYFTAQPTWGNSPLWVWFTDQSIGGNSINWWFGDGLTSTNRSDYHTYTKNGIYLSQQQIKGNGTNVYNKGIYVGVQPPWFSAYSSMASASELTLLRRYRDKVLSNDPKGKTYKSRLYDNSGAALTVLLSHPELLLKARNLIQANKGAVIQVLQGHEGIIYDPEEVLAFLQSFGEKAPPQLRALINVVRKEIRQSQRRGKPFFGFRLGPQGPQR